MGWWGKTFAHDDRTYKKKINRKEYKIAIKSILTSLLKDKRLIVIDSLEVKEPKTKEMIKVLTDLQIDDALIVVDQKENNLDLATRNIPRVELITADKINPLILIKYENVVIDAEALKKIESIYG